ncbi:MAG: thermonuclease family protein [Bacteriovoracaceae bacterium]|nr:thermonuclease family protein [Bacteriovoracaceae bacterium]
MVRKVIFLGSGLFLALFISPIEQKAHFKVLKVLDGDSVILQNAQGKLKARLLYIDAPELTQRDLKGEVAVGINARAYLEHLIGGREVKVLVKGRDIYRRGLVRIWAQDNDINLAMVAAGHAIIYPSSRFEWMSEKIRYLRAFHLSRLQKLGMWKTSGLMNPYHYRRHKKKH